MMTIATASLLLLTSVHGQTPHEDFEKAKLDIATIQFYVISTLDEMNSTLESILVDDINSTLEHQSTFSRRIKDISNTLDRIPLDVDSYDILLGYRDSLTFTNENLTGLVSAFESVLGAIDLFNSISLSDWNYTIMKEKLVALDHAFSLFGPSIEQMRGFAQDLKNDLGLISDLGLDTANQRRLLDLIEIRIDELHDEGASPDLIAPILMEGLFPFWDGSIGNLSAEYDPFEELGLRSGILTTISPDLDGELRTIVDEIGMTVQISHNVLDGMRRNQTGFLVMMDYLEEGNTSLGIDHLDMYNKASAHLLDLEEGLVSQKDTYEWFEVHLADVPRENLSVLEALIGSYRFRFEEFSPLTTQFQELSGYLSTILEMNLVEVLIIDDLNMSTFKVMDLKLPDDLPSKIEEMMTLNELLDDELVKVERIWPGELTSLYRPLNRTSIYTYRFSISHIQLVENLREMNNSFVRSSFDDDRERLVDTIGLLQTMEIEFDRLKRFSSEVNRTEIGMDLSSLSLLQLQLDNYKVIIANLSEKYDITGLFLRMPDQPVPYDDVLEISIILIVEQVVGGIDLPTGEYVEVYMDGILIEELITDDGWGSISLVVDRNWTLGEHAIDIHHNASDQWDNGSFWVRRIMTRLDVAAPYKVIEPDEVIVVSASLIDEFGRILKETIFIGGVEHDNPGIVYSDISFNEPGERYLDFLYPGDGWTFLSTNAIIFNVSWPSTILLYIETGEVFLDEWINGTVEMVQGQGRSFLHHGNNTSYLGATLTEQSYNFSINSSKLGIGLHRFMVSHSTDVNWSRNGNSNSIWVRVIERPGPVEPPINQTPDDDDDDDDIILPDDDEDNGKDGPFARQFRIIALVILLLLVFIIVVLFVQRRRKTGDKMKFVFPSVKKKTIKVLALEEEVVTEPDVKRTTLEPDLKKARAILSKDRSDPSRDAVIASYLEVIDRSPDAIGLKRSQTPREVWSRLSEEGADRNDSISLVTNFEDAVYKEGSPSTERVDRVKLSAGRLLTWFTSTKPVNEEQR